MKNKSIEDTINPPADSTKNDSARGSCHPIPFSSRQNLTGNASIPLSTSNAHLLPLLGGLLGGKSGGNAISIVLSSSGGAVIPVSLPTTSASSASVPPPVLSISGGISSFALIFLMTHLF